jgi:hypothetical protein
MGSSYAGCGGIDDLARTRERDSLRKDIPTLHRPELSSMSRNGSSRYSSDQVFLRMADKMKKIDDRIWLGIAWIFGWAFIVGFYGLIFWRVSR